MDYILYRIAGEPKVKSRGFTIVELLIVIAVIGILAAIVTVTFTGVQTKARYSKTQSDMETLEKAIFAARINSGKTLGQITGHWCSGCVFGGEDGTTVPSTMDPTTRASNPNWTRYYNALNAIGAAAGTNLDGLKMGDGWGNWYAFDENEGEGGSGCNRDRISSRGSLWIGTDTEQMYRDLPRSGNTGCPTP